MNAVRVGINGFGRMGRLTLRAAWGGSQLEFVHVNELNGDPATSAHLLTFDSVQGRYGHRSHSSSPRGSFHGCYPATPPVTRCSGAG